jgi:hypothetical protein
VGWDSFVPKLGKSRGQTSEGPSRMDEGPPLQASDNVSRCAPFLALRSRAPSSLRGRGSGRAHPQ